MYHQQKTALKFQAILDDNLKELRKHSNRPKTRKLAHGINTL